MAKDPLHHCSEPAHVVNDEAAALALDQAGTVKIVEFPCHRLAAGAQAAGHGLMGRRSQDDGRVVIAHVVARKAQQLGVDPVLHGEGTELKETLRGGSQFDREMLQGRGRDLRVISQHFPEDFGGHRGNERVGLGHHARRARLTVNRRQLAEHLAGAEIRKSYLFS